MNKFKRIFMIVTDGVGIGPDKNQKKFGDAGANTLYSASLSSMFFIETWKKLGIGHIAQLEGNYKVKNPLAYMARVEEISNAKDSLAGHWEMMGSVTRTPFATFEGDFPKELVAELKKACDNREIVGKKSASGTVMLDVYADEQKKNGSLIVYSSHDSTLQIAAHEKWVGLDNLYRYGVSARKICSSRPEWNVGRVIVVPFIGENGKYERTFNRHDFPVEAPETILNKLQDKGVEVVAIGKINDLFNTKGIKRTIRTKGDADGMDKTIAVAKESSENVFVYTNLIQFDTDYGHHRDVNGFANNIAMFDAKLGKLIQTMNNDDLLIITSDHGNDPAYPNYTHTRELLPLTIYSKAFKNPRILPDIKGLGTAGNIVAKNFGVEISKEAGEDIFDKLI